MSYLLFKFNHEPGNVPARDIWFLPRDQNRITSKTCCWNIWELRQSKCKSLEGCRKLREYPVDWAFYIIFFAFYKFLIEKTQSKLNVVKEKCFSWAFIENLIVGEILILTKKTFGWSKLGISRIRSRNFTLPQFPTKTNRWKSSSSSSITSVGINGSSFIPGTYRTTSWPSLVGVRKVRF